MAVSNCSQWDRSSCLTHMASLQDSINSPR
ncbi:unnamed protein product [Spirodela intermedia]|uniref:Uncharacterized protein n=2 Tax=Spirodela intermedia TaxID=51605 RepID=A0A7I8LE21_SPIIN|nr:unnamed protein product [Spirodela intermedia]CAA6670962.1 unnamed protein product [Spirodela intermedia]CAA7408062.1 unnamed protein product [Spirodela intermedia]